MNTPVKPCSLSCVRCGSPTQFQVQVVVSAPGELFRNLGKSAYRRKDVQVMGVLWETADHICTKPECGLITNGYGNYVTNLKKEKEALQADADRYRMLLNNVYLDCLTSDSQQCERSKRAAIVEKVVDSLSGINSEVKEST